MHFNTLMVLFTPPPPPLPFSEIVIQDNLSETYIYILLEPFGHSDLEHNVFKADSTERSSNKCKNLKSARNTCNILNTIWNISLYVIHFHKWSHG